MNRINIVVIAIISIIISACSDFSKEKPVARVYQKYLYPSDFKKNFPQDMTPQDSVQLANAFIQSWIKNAVILHQAETTLSEEDNKSLNELIEKYRESLVLYKYESHEIEQKGDTIVSDTEIENYYNENKRNFILSESIVKVNYIFLPVTDKKPSPYFKKLMNNSYKSDELIKYCDDNAIGYSLNNDWKLLRNINPLLPANLQFNENNISKSKFIDSKDSHYRYLIYLKDCYTVNNISPLEYVKDNIRNIIINKRKKQLINNIEQNLYKTAFDKNEIEIY